MLPIGPCTHFKYFNEEENNYFPFFSFPSSLELLNGLLMECGQIYFDVFLIQNNVHGGGSVMLTDLDLQITIHYGIPSTASVLAFDPIQSLLAIGTL